MKNTDKKEESKRLGFDVTKKYGHLTWVKSSEDLVYLHVSRQTLAKPASVWQCDCGKNLIAQNAPVVSGKIVSCGCHMTTKQRLKKLWRGMIRRCENPKHSGYQNYGGRGILVCSEWRKSFRAFETWALKAGYENSLSIDRIDVNGNYCPENCRWATNLEQANNRRNTHYISYGGVTLSLAQWARKTGLDSSRISQRARCSTSKNKLLSKRNLGLRLITIHGETKNMSEWLREYKISSTSFYYRIKRGMTEEEAITTKKVGKQRLVTINGDTKNISEWCKHFGMSPGTYYHRRVRGDDVVTALTKKLCPCVNYEKH